MLLSKESLHLPARPVITAVLRDTMKGTLFAFRTCSVSDGRRRHLRNVGTMLNVVYCNGQYQIGVQSRSETSYTKYALHN
jgi:hypothetical protein